MKQTHISIVAPTFNDWASLARLIKDIDTLPELAGFYFNILAVDDGSNERNFSPIVASRYSRIQSIKAVELACNLGHQRAIAIGLVQALKTQDAGCIIVMDSDGEDRPQDIKKLVDHWRAAPNSIVCAQRARRSESVGFKMFYAIYKLAFKNANRRTHRFRELLPHSTEPAGRGVSQFVELEQSCSDTGPLPAADSADTDGSRSPLCRSVADESCSADHARHERYFGL